MEYCKFLEHYRHYTDGNETPESIHLWSGLSTIAGAAERKLWIDRSLFQLYLNLYLMFLAPAGVCKKSTAVELSTSLLQEVDAKIYEGSITKAKIVNDMTESVQKIETPTGDLVHTSITYIGDEFNELIAMGGGDMIKFLTRIFNCPKHYTHRTITSTCVDIPFPWLNITGNVVPQWFSLNLANDMSATGLLSRFIIVHEEEKRGCYPEPIRTPEMLFHRQGALEILFWIKQQSGEMMMSPDARLFYNMWYEKNHKLESGADFRYAEYYERKITIHILKIAGLMALGDCRKTIEVIDLQRAVHLTDRTDKKLKNFYQMSGTNKYAPYVTRVVSILEGLGGKIPARKIYEVFAANLTTDEITLVIKQLQMTGIAVVKSINNVSYLVRAKGEE